MNCPQCGTQFTSFATQCPNCGRPLPLDEQRRLDDEMAARRQADLEEAARKATAREAAESDPRKIWMGIAVGMIPVILAWIALGANSTFFGYAAGVLYALEIIAAVVCLIIRDWRMIGYGLLTMIFMGPIVWSIGCVVILVASSRG